MNAIDRLRYDHEILRQDLAGVEEALHATGGEEPRSALRMGCRILVDRLRDHSRREGRLVVLASWRLGRLGAGELARFALDHDLDQGLLRTIARFAADEGRFGLDGVGASARGFVSRCRRRLAEQEEQLFPLLHRLLQPEEPAREPLWRRAPERQDAAVLSGAVAAVASGRWGGHSEMSWR